MFLFLIINNKTPNFLFVAKRMVNIIPNNDINVKINIRANNNCEEIIVMVALFVIKYKQINEIVQAKPNIEYIP